MEKKLPISKNFFAPNSRLNRKRIKKIYKYYKAMSNSTLEKNIEIANKLIAYPIKDPFVSLEKFFEYCGKTIIGVYIVILLADLNKSFTDIAMKKSLELIIAIIFIYGITLFIWKYLFKRVYFESTMSRKEKLKDYVFVMENILLLRSQKRKAKES